MILLDSIEDSAPPDLIKLINQKNVKSVITTILTMVLNLIQKFVIDVTGE